METSNKLTINLLSCTCDLTQTLPVYFVSKDRIKMSGGEKSINDSMG